VGSPNQPIARALYNNRYGEIMKEKARKFAIERHGDQKYGEHPYFMHLDEVAKIAKNYGENAEIVAYLHDVVEDTKTDIKEIEDEFGHFVANCVSILTDESGRNRKERKMKTYSKMSKVSGDLELALIVKAADRLANLKACIRTNNENRLLMYKSESLVFKQSVYRENICEPLWQKIEEITNT
jgi:(p)ppGpp synthase/HD superfamily hydrolase